MIFIADRNGQLGNRLATFAHFIGWGLENDVRIFNPGFDEYAKYFEGTYADPWCRFPAKTANGFDAWTKKLSYPLIYFAARQCRRINLRTALLASQNCRGEIFDLSTRGQELLASKISIVRGWQYWDKRNAQKHRDAICDHFTPRLEHRQNIAECVARARADREVLVGVHIRRGDYANHLNGRYFFDHSVYRNAMESVRALFPDKEVGFLICSNEPVNVSTFSGFNVHVGPNHIIEDMYSFASCDYLVGPPSTYSIWASYYGKVPLLEIQSPSPIVHLTREQFFVH